MKKMIMCIFFLFSPWVVSAEEYPATLEWANTFHGAIPLTGIIRNVNVQAGQRVGAGKKLVSLDARSYTAARKSRLSSLQSLTGTYEEVKREHERAEELFDRTVLSTTEMQLAELNLSIAEANVKGAQAELNQAEALLSYATIKAPFDAIVIELNTSPGEAISVESSLKTLLILAKPGHFRIRFWVPEKGLSALSVEQTVTLKTTNKSYDVAISSIGLMHKTENDWTLFAVDGLLQSNDTTLLPGIQASISIP